MKKFKSLAAAILMLTTVTSAYRGTIVTAAVKTVPNGTYLLRNVNSGMYMDVADANNNESNVQQGKATEAFSYNTWKLESDDNGYYSIYSMVGDESNCLTVTQTDKLLGDNICIGNNKGTDNQLYKLSANSDGSFKILTKCSNNTNSVEIINADTEAGANVQQWEVNGANCQDWELIPIDYAVSSNLQASECEIIGDDFTPGDFNDDGEVNVFDMIAAKRLIVSQNVTEHQEHCGNVNGDNSFTDDDVKLIRDFILKAEDKLIKCAVDTQRLYSAVDGNFELGKSETTNEGFLSNAYLNLDNQEGVEAFWNIEAEQDGVYAVTFRYANGGAASRQVMVNLNNKLSYWKGEFATTSSWTTWDEETINLPLKKGVNKITITSLTADGAANLDKITVCKTNNAESQAYPIEAIVGIPESSSNINEDGRRMENLDRGITAAYTGSGMLVSWRTLATDAENTTFKVYNNNNLVKEIAADEATNYFISGATASDNITVDTYVNGSLTEKAQPAIVLGTKNSGQSGAYMDIAIDKPADQTMPDGTTCTYMPNDCSVGDVDGDGEYEIFLKWDPSNSKDNANDGYTGTVFIDCYKLDGTKLWRIDLGKNIRAGAHYTQFQVYDFDCDGKAELICKTADGTYDGLGNCIGNATVDNRGSNGRILTGNEYLTLFDGLTGKAVDTIDYEPGRGSLTNANDSTYFGDAYGNRCDRFLSAVAYLDGKTPSAVFCRGYYARTALVAYDVSNDKLVKRWIFDTKNDKNNAYYGQGNHSLVVMDADKDGKDEIIYGSCCIDDNGTGLWSTGLKHGDCMQAGDLIPERDGLEIFQVHEEVQCAEVHDVATGEIIWKIDATGDVGRGIALNVSASTSGMEFVSVVDSTIYAFNKATGKIESTGNAWSSITKWGMNSAVWWDGDLEREALDRAMVDKPGRIFTGDGVTYNNWSKSNACITCDLFGDWREEMIFSTSDGNALRVFGTTYETDIKLITLMHDSQYRTGVAIENVGYNQAPNTSFFLGTGYNLPEKPQIYTINAD